MSQEEHKAWERIAEEAKANAETAASWSRLGNPDEKKRQEEIKEGVKATDKILKKYGYMFPARIIDPIIQMLRLLEKED